MVDAVSQEAIEEVMVRGMDIPMEVEVVRECHVPTRDPMLPCRRAPAILISGAVQIHIEGPAVRTPKTRLRHRRRSQREGTVMTEAVSMVVPLTMDQWTQDLVLHLPPCTMAERSDMIRHLLLEIHMPHRQTRMARRLRMEEPEADMVRMAEVTVRIVPTGVERMATPTAIMEALAAEIPTPTMMAPVGVTTMVLEGVRIPINLALAMAGLVDTVVAEVGPGTEARVGATEVQEVAMVGMEGTEEARLRMGMEGMEVVPRIPTPHRGHLPLRGIEL